MGVGIVAVLLLTLLVAVAPAPAEATEIKITVNGPGHLHRRPIHRDPRVGYPDPRVDDRDARADHVHRRRNIHHHGPVVIFPAPVFVIGPRRCAVPGYWAYTWVPESYVSNVWVPGYYNFDALWVEGHYEPRAYTWGSYHPYWVPERWTYC